MASKSIYTVVAIAGIAVASGAAWWLQKPRQAEGTDAAATPTAPGPGRGKGAGTPSAAGGPGRAPAVEVARVETMRITDDAQAVGSLRSRQSVVLRPEVSGRVTQINFRDADRVRRGQLLVQLDDELPMALVKQAEAEVSIARANHRRNRELVEEKFIAQRAVDESAANLQVADAKLALARATLARLKILAPFDGVAGIRSINVGDYLKDGADIVNIEDLDALYVDFRLPERFQTKVKPGQTALLDVDALPGQRFSAMIQAIDPLVDANGRSVGIRGCVDNRHLKLRPGMFARITPVFGVREDARMIPEEAIVPQSGRQFVYRLVDGPDQDTRIAQRVEVKVGVRQQGKVEVTQGLGAGDTVVTAGQQRILKDGTPVRVLDVSGRSGQPAAAAAGGPPAATAAAPELVPNSRGNPCSVASGAPGGRSAPATRPVQGG
ncbi:efflux RND transporter periplasmic adaptor subunit [Ramlibacter sp. PS3R-8]|uniref:efflux RND transporter periplasmic adaptor subunit n=1 Tax=Ramlibacter sp. PS3R-8 TaxID=3133437 RepID=UPI00309536FE